MFKREISCLSQNILYVASDNTENETLLIDKTNTASYPARQTTRVVCSGNNADQVLCVVLYEQLTFQTEDQPHSLSS